VGDAQVGQDVTFTIVARNNGPDSVELFVNTSKSLNSLRVVSISCGGVTNDGAWCEYHFFKPGETVTTTIVGEVQATGSEYANDTACVASPELIDDPNPSNDCGTATVRSSPTGDGTSGSQPGR
jgi:hypothetical protein